MRHQHSRLFHALGDRCGREEGCEKRISRAPLDEPLSCTPLSTTHEAIDDPGPPGSPPAGAEPPPNSYFSHHSLWNALSFGLIVARSSICAAFPPTSTPLPLSSWMSAQSEEGVASVGLPTPVGGCLPGDRDLGPGPSIFSARDGVVKKGVRQVRLWRMSISVTWAMEGALPKEDSSTGASCGPLLRQPSRRPPKKSDPGRHST